MDSLWSWFFPGVLIDVFGIQLLPGAALFLYVFVLFAVFKYPQHRAGLILFLGLTVLVGVLNSYSGRPRYDDIWKPLGLFAVMAMPVGVMIFHLFKGRVKGAVIWGLVSLAGWAFGLGWSLWVHALARS